MIKSSESEFFTGSLYFASGHENYVVKIYLDFDDIKFITDNGEEYSAFYEKTKFGLGGFEHRQLQIDAVCTDNQQVTCFVVLEEKSKFLKKCETLGHGIDRKQITDITRSDKNNSRLFGLYVFLAMFLVIAGTGLFFIYSKPFAKFIVSYLPVEQESMIGKVSVQKILLDKQKIEKGELFDKIQAILHRVESGISNTPYKFKLYLADDPTVNAMAAPGGHVIVFTGILQNIESSEELAGILAHECAHVIHRHSMVSIVKNAISVSMVFALLSGIGVEGVVAELSASAVKLSYSRDDEREADETGINILHRAGIDPNNFANFFERQNQKKDLNKNLSSVMSIFSTHPSDTERIARLGKTINNLEPKIYAHITPDYAQLQSLLNK